MSTAATPLSTPPAPVTAAVHNKINKGPHKVAIFIFLGLFSVGIVYALSNLISDVTHVHHPSTSAFLLLGVALLVALGFEFVNGFHDTANAVATVTHIHPLHPE